MLLFALLLAADSPATSAAATQTAPEDKIHCQREGATDTRIRTKKVCRKRSEWDQIAKAAQEDMKRSANQRQVPAN